MITDVPIKQSDYTSKQDFKGWCDMFSCFSLNSALIERFFQVPRSFRHDRGDAVLARPAPERAEAHTCPWLGQRLTIKGQDLTFSGFVKHFPSGWGVFLFLARRSFSISPSSRIKPGLLFVVAFLLQIWTLCRRFHSISKWTLHRWNEPVVYICSLHICLF